MVDDLNSFFLNGDDLNKNRRRPKQDGKWPAFLSLMQDASILQL
jgi:hypothetical protein